MYKFLKIFGFVSRTETRIKTYAFEEKVVKNSTTSLAKWVLPLCVLNFALLFSYILDANKITEIGLETRSVIRKNSEISEENKKLGIKLAESISLPKIEEDLKSQGFVSIGFPKYIDLSGGVLSFKK